MNKTLALLAALALATPAFAADTKTKTESVDAAGTATSTETKTSVDADGDSKTTHTKTVDPKGLGNKHTVKTTTEKKDGMVHHEKKVDGDTVEESKTTH